MMSELPFLNRRRCGKADRPPSPRSEIKWFYPVRSPFYASRFNHASRY